MLHWYTAVYQVPGTYFPVVAVCGTTKQQDGEDKRYTYTCVPSQYNYIRRVSCCYYVTRASFIIHYRLRDRSPCEEFSRFTPLFFAFSSSCCSKMSYQRIYIVQMIKRAYHTIPKGPTQTTDWQLQNNTGDQGSGDGTWDGGGTHWGCSCHVHTKTLFGTSEPVRYFLTGVLFLVEKVEATWISFHV